MTTHEEAVFLDTLASVLAEQEQLPIFICLHALCEVVKFYAAPPEQTALDTYVYLRTGEESRALVHQFRASVRAYQQEIESL